MNLIFASDQNDVIGIDGKLPWRQKEDLIRFKKLTSANHKEATESPILIMGRKTYESLGVETLPGRRIIVVGRNPTPMSFFDKRYGRVMFARNVQEVQDRLDFPWRVIFRNETPPPVWVVGGAAIYSLLLDQVDTIYWTKIYGKVEVPEGSTATTWPFPWDAPFRCVEQSERHQANEENQFDYQFLKFKRMA